MKLLDYIFGTNSNERSNSRPKPSYTNSPVDADYEVIEVDPYKPAIANQLRPAVIFKDG